MTEETAKYRPHRKWRNGFVVGLGLLGFPHGDTSPERSSSAISANTMILFDAPVKECVEDLYKLHQDFDFKDHPVDAGRAAAALVRKKLFLSITPSAEGLQCDYHIPKATFFVKFPERSGSLPGFAKLLQYCVDKEMQHFQDGRHPLPEYENIIAQIIDSYQQQHPDKPLGSLEEYKFNLGRALPSLAQKVIEHREACRYGARHHRSMEKLRVTFTSGKPTELFIPITIKPSAHIFRSDGRIRPVSHKAGPSL